MKLNDLFKTIPSAQKVRLFYEDSVVAGTQDSLICLLDDFVFNGVATIVEAEDDEVQVWVKEDAHAAQKMDGGDPHD